jgi:hypothetical protein
MLFWDLRRLMFWFNVNASLKGTVSVISEGCISGNAAAFSIRSAVASMSFFPF